MKERINSSVAVMMSLILCLHPMLGLGSNKEMPRAIESKSARLLGNRLAASTKSGSAKAAFSSHLLSKRPRQDNHTGSLPGQSLTLLSDGRLLRTGGLDQNGPVASTSIEEVGTLQSASSALHNPRAWHTATLLPDGNVLITGGIGLDGQARFRHNEGNAVAGSDLHAEDKWSDQ